jgi:predicted 3-demethylubiquinone-9 3-methyltransferase (glyoxalase superfamily)
VKGITPFLWFDKEAEQAAKFYASVFKGSKVKAVTRYGEEGPGPKGSVMTVSFEIAGQELVALNGGPQFPFTHAVSFVVNCETQEEVDYYWERLSQGGQTEQCGWLRDRYGLSWQIVPTLFDELSQEKDPAKFSRVMKAMLQMTKLDIAALKQAAAGR